MGEEAVYYLPWPSKSPQHLLLLLWTLPIVPHLPLSLAQLWASSPVSWHSSHKHLLREEDYFFLEGGICFLLLLWTLLVNVAEGALSSLKNKNKKKFPFYS